MRSIFLSACLLFSSMGSAADLVKDFSQDLSKEQRNLLADFLMAVVDSSGGYVLFGDKPMSVESYDIASLQALTSPDPKVVALVKGKELWEDLKISPEKKEHLITTFELDKRLYVVAINRASFVNVVNDNLTLFRYVLGPALTAESLIHQLISAGPEFFSVLKKDQTLTEMLLGNGKQNSLLHARLMKISDPNAFGTTEEFPLVSKKLSRSWAASSKKFTQEPSFGFQSLNEEEFRLNKVTMESAKLKPFASCQIPRFECDPELEETKVILGTYEQNRNKILKSVASKSFLEDSLRKLFVQTDGLLEIPAVPKQRDLCIPVSREETARKLVELIHKKIALEPLGVKKFQTAFIQGVAAREKGKQLPVPNQFKRVNDLATVQKEIEACKNQELAAAYFDRLSSREDLVALIPNEIYYKILKAGKENTASTKTSKVSLQYSYQILGDPNSKDWGIVKQESLGALIPGIAHAVIGMQQGEERVVYIHPKHAYGEDSFYAPNISIVAQIRLLDWQEGEQPVAILPPHQLEQRDYKDLLAKFEVLRSEELFDEGVAFWDGIKKSGDFIDFQTFQKLYLNNEEGQTTFQSASQEEKFMVDLEYHLLSLQKRN